MPIKVRLCSFIQFRGARGDSRGLIHFVECCDEFFKIEMVYNERGFEKVVVSILVMKLDFCSMQWKVVNSLRNRVLFVGSKTAYCFISELGLTRGCLYYTLPEDHGLYKFDVENATDSVILPCPEIPTPGLSSYWITLPNGLGRKEGMSGKDEGGYLTRTISYYGTENKNEDASRGEKHNRRQLEEGKPWCILNSDMVELIASYLHPVDYVHFRSINKANQEVMPAVKSRFILTTQTFETEYLCPWLVFTRDNNSSIYNFVNLMHNNENYLIKFSELLLGATIRYQKGGWLLMSREIELFFYNPFTKETIQLADFPGCHYLSDISFTSLPTAPDCTVFGIDKSGFSISITIYSIRRGEQQWEVVSFEDSDVEKYSPSRNTLTLFDGVFYSVGYDGTLNKLSVSFDTFEFLEKPQEIFNDSYPSFLVKCGEDLVLVKLCPKMLVRIFRMDFSRMEWVKVESLGKHMLFISNITCFSAIAPNSQMENKVYFPRLYLDGEGILCYSLETGSYRSFGGTSQHSSNNIYGTKGWLSNCSWIQPNWSKSTAQELDWLNSLT
ncbi:F-box protein At3g56470-like [Papaver somniferum]|uniref:F-box protein At3g56470-like n=1 Tax=Papaver somniferum TaxID=3469 RepID=UPI000E70075F|nr:F-box protein At3g56470-like [Papaver somniferum]